MSLKLVKKSLFLLDSLDNDTPSSVTGRLKDNGRTGAQKCGSKLTKCKTKTIHSKTDKKRKAVVFVQKIKKGLENEKQVNCKIESNIDKLKNLSNAGRIHKKLETNIIKNISGIEPASKNKRKKEIVEEKSAFTEEDFENFMKEYVE